MPLNTKISHEWKFTLTRIQAKSVDFSLIGSLFYVDEFPQHSQEFGQTKTQFAMASCAEADTLHDGHHPQMGPSFAVVNYE